MLRSLRSAAKHPATVRWTCVRMDSSPSIKMPRSRTLVDGWTRSDPTLNAVDGSWCCRRAVEHQSRSVLLVFSCRRLALIHDATSSMQADRCSWKSETADGLQEPYTCVSSAYRWGQKPCCSTREIRSDHINSHIVAITACMIYPYLHTVIACALLAGLSSDTIHITICRTYYSNI